MNIILFEKDEVEHALPIDDKRAEHILKVLRRKVGDTFDAGVINGPKGKGVVKAITPESLEVEFEWKENEPELLPIDLIIGLSRPQTNRKILQEATSLGVRSMFFVDTERGEPSYKTSRLWTTGEWRRHIVAGAEQAFATRIPEISYGISIETAMERCAATESKLALDNYEATIALAKVAFGQSTVLALGSERGWTASERDLFRNAGYALAHLGDRPLRAETATIAAVSIASALA